MFRDVRSILYRSDFAALVLATAALVGMADSFYLNLAYLAALMHPGEPTPCTVNTLVSCTLTVQGPWGHYIPGVPNPMLGMLWYSGAFGYGMTRLLGAAFSRNARAFVGCVLLAGIAFSYRLYFASLFDLGGVCPFCLISTTASTLIILAFAVDDASTADRFVTRRLQRLVDAVQAISVLSFVVGLPWFLARGLRWIPHPAEAVLHWSFPVMAGLIVIMAVGNAWAFAARRR